MPKVSDLTPTERLAIMALHFGPHQNLSALQANTGTRTEKHLARALRALRMAGIISAEIGADGVERFFLPALTRAEKP